MMKARYFVLAAALVTGTALGLMDVFHFGRGAEPSAEEGEIPLHSQNAPFFGKPPVKKDVAQIAPTFANFGVLIPLYANMSLDELRAEIKRLYELVKKKRMDDEVGIRFLLQYLARKAGRDYPGELHFFLDKGLTDSCADYALPLLVGWGSKDFGGAMAYLLENQNKCTYSSYVFSKMVRELTEKNPDKAMEWMMSQKGKIRQNALSEMLGVLAEKHPSRMSDFVEKILPEDFVFYDVAKKWGICDWESALLWADTLSDKKRKKL